MFTLLFIIAEILRANLAEIKLQFLRVSRYLLSDSLFPNIDYNRDQSYLKTQMRGLHKKHVSLVGEEFRLFLRNFSIHLEKVSICKITSIVLGQTHVTCAKVHRWLWKRRRCNSRSLFRIWRVRGELANDEKAKVERHFLGKNRTSLAQTHLCPLYLISWLSL